MASRYRPPDGCGLLLAAKPLPTVNVSASVRPAATIGVLGANSGKSKIEELVAGISNPPNNKDKMDATQICLNDMHEG